MEGLSKKQNLIKEISQTLESKEKFIPKVELEIEPPENREARQIMWFLNSSSKLHSDFINSLFKSLPELKEISFIENEQEKYVKIQNLLKNKREKNKDFLLENFNSIKNDWESRSNNYLKRLSDLFETDWIENKNIKGYVALNSPYPRFLDDYSFFMPFEKARETIAHEILHFIWFKKWKEIFPETERKEMENPYLVWKISEIIDPIILQTDPIIKELIEPKRWGYAEFENIKINGIKMQEYFTKVYLDSRNAGDSFDITMKKLYEEAKLHEKELDF